MISMPSAPDPVATAQAQSGFNRDTAVTSAYLNMIDQNTPDGSLKYDQTGTTSYVDSQGKTIEIPRFTATTTLSEQQQRIKDQTDGAKLNLATTANNQSAFLQNYLGQSVDTSGAPGLVSNPNLRTSIGGGFRNNIGGSFSTDVDPGWQNSVNLRDSYAGADDFSADRQRYEDALWQRTAPDRAQQEASLRTTLANKGIREGSSAWDAEMARLGRQNTDARLATLLAGGQEQQRMVGLARDAAQFGNDARLAQATFGNTALGTLFGLRNNASLQQAQFTNQSALQEAGFENQAAMQNAQFQNAARGQYLEEQYAQRNRPINEISALLSGSQVSQPTFRNTPQTQVAGVDYAGMVQKQYEAQVANSNAAMGGLFGMGSGLFGLLGKALPFSDRRLKTDIERIGMTNGGTAVYRFRYRGDPVFHIGVMADEVPEAAVPDPSGYFRVDYEKVA